MYVKCPQNIEVNVLAETHPEMGNDTVCIVWMNKNVPRQTCLGKIYSRVN